MFKRSLALPAPGKETFFLWGPRQTGKSTLLRATYPDAYWVDLLESDEYRRYLARPELLRQELVTRRRRCIVCLEPKRRRTDDGINVLPVDAFIEDLAGGRLF